MTDEALTACREDSDATHALISAFAGSAEDRETARLKALRGDLSALRGRYEQARARYASARAVIAPPA